MEERKKMTFKEQLLLIFGCSFIVLYGFFRSGILAFTTCLFCEQYEIYSEISFTFLLLTFIIWYGISFIITLLFFLYINYKLWRGENEK